MLRRLCIMPGLPSPPLTLTVTHPLPNFMTIPFAPAKGPMAISTIFLDHWMLGRAFRRGRWALLGVGMCITAICLCSL